MQNARYPAVYATVPPFSNGRYFAHNSDPASEAWRELRLLAEVPAEGLALFHGTLVERRKYWREFANFVRQARANYDAASNMHGSSAGLLHYYCALNLAKAELLVANPGNVFNKKLGHGLSFSPAVSKRVRTDKIKVQAGGVFNMLYSHRTGLSLAQHLDLPVGRLVAQCGEVEGEAARVGYNEPRPSGILHAACANGGEGFSLIGLINIGSGPNFVDCTNAMHAFRKKFREVNPPNNVYQVLGAGGRLHRTIADGPFFESIETIPLSPNANGAYELLPVCEKTEKDLGLLLGPPIHGHEDGRLIPSLYKSKELMLTEELARYALIFYLSSLVRYKPSNLDPVQFPDEAWLFDAFALASIDLIVRSAADRIQGKTTFYFDYSTIRT